MLIVRRTTVAALAATAATSLGMAPPVLDPRLRTARRRLAGRLPCSGRVALVRPADAHPS
jgi:hypothetical protein